MSRARTSQRLNDLVEAFTEMGPAWARWVHANLPQDSVSYARLRVLQALECAPSTDGLTMKQLSDALEVTPRRITALVDALEAEELVERYPHPTDGRSTLVALTPAGLEQQRIGWQQTQGNVGLAFGDLPVEDQERLLEISHKLTEAFRSRLAALTAPAIARDVARKPLPPRVSRGRPGR